MLNTLEVIFIGAAPSFLFFNFIGSNEKSQLNWQSLLLIAKFLIYLGITSCGFFALFLTKLFMKEGMVLKRIAKRTCNRAVLIDGEWLDITIVSDYKD